ncbi:dolichol-phosphate mannosyltransferase [Ekhidna lutea]|uniref:Dolichol-phosphate mannosyltransferase n=1 Tax=Ekhidna lutea TaxID=447679 RepID=A0A239HRJ6_EKHLU|nr:glycosyltransferase family 2 protein [Ekhidna lutea]SNS83967.1 dolichol-phosphate mannosyltransferase [Ekhidna lutea]
MNISFIILVYNDSGSLPSLLAQLDQTLKSNFNNYEIIAVNDCSTDKSEEVLKSLQSHYPFLRIHTNQKNLNVGGAFQQGVAICKYEYIGYTDGDFQYDMRDITKYCEYLPEYHILTGYRFNRKDSVYRKIASTFFNHLITTFFQLKLKDVNSGLKIFDSQKLKAIGSWSTGASYDLEIIVKMKYQQSAKFKEVKINHKPRVHGKAMGLSGANVANIIESLLYTLSIFHKKSFRNHVYKKLLTLVLFSISNKHKQ